jgi:diguanylate cyclase (GGDEF)-like protein/PAS domain S-box-containing protein
VTPEAINPSIGNSAPAALERLVRGAILETGPDLIVRRAVSTGAAAEEGFIVAAALVGHPLWTVFAGPAAAGPGWGAFGGHLAGHEAFDSFKFSLVRRGMGSRHFRASGEPVHEGDEFRGYVVLVTDVTNLVEQSLARTQTEQVLAAVSENCPALIVLKDVEGRYLNVNRAAAEIYGVASGDMKNRRPEDVLPPEVAATCRLLDDDVLESETVRETEQSFMVGGEQRTFLTQKFPLHDSSGCLLGVGAVGTDISELKFASERLYRQSHFDDVTDLPRRALAMDRLGQVLASARRNETFAGVAMLQFPNFAVVAETFGHRKADDFIREIVARLKKTMRESDTVARLSDDTFCIILSDIAVENDIAIISDKIFVAMAPQFDVMGVEVKPTPCIGFSLYPTDATASENLIQFADLAMRQALKNKGRGYCRFVAGMDEECRRRQQVESALEQALERGEFSVVYQPLIDLATGRIASAEALIRWNHPILGPVTPDVFIPIAEQSGLICDIGYWVLEQSVKAAAAWRTSFDADISVAVNVSTRQLSDTQLAARVKALLDDVGLAPGRLKIEVTESALAEDLAGARAVLDDLKALGVDLCLDDFGTGYSALSYLANYSFDVLKIDRSFVRDVADNRLSASLADSIIKMARRLGIKVVAEGVEDERQLAFLKKRGCDFVQGYYFSKPLAPADIHAFIATSLSRLAA